MELQRPRDTTSSRPERKLFSPLNPFTEVASIKERPTAYCPWAFLVQLSGGQLGCEVYGTDNVIVWLLVSLPDVAVTVMV